MGEVQGDPGGIEAAGIEAAVHGGVEGHGLELEGPVGIALDEFDGEGAMEGREFLAEFEGIGAAGGGNGEGCRPEGEGFEEGGVGGGIVVEGEEGGGGGDDFEGEGAGAGGGSGRRRDGRVGGGEIAVEGSGVGAEGEGGGVFGEGMDAKGGAAPAAGDAGADVARNAVEVGVEIDGYFEEGRAGGRIEEAVGAGADPERGASALVDAGAHVGVEGDAVGEEGLPAGGGKEGVIGGGEDEVAPGRRPGVRAVGLAGEEVVDDGGEVGLGEGTSGEAAGDFGEGFAGARGVAALEIPAEEEEGFVVGEGDVGDAEGREEEEGEGCGEEEHPGGDLEPADALAVADAGGVGGAHVAAALGAAVGGGREAGEIEAAFAAEGVVVDAPAAAGEEEEGEGDERGEEEEGHAGRSLDVANGGIVPGGDWAGG